MPGKSNKQVVKKAAPSPAKKQQQPTKQQNVAVNKKAAPSPAKKQQQQQQVTKKSNTPIKNNKPLPKKANKKQEEEIDFNDADLKKQLQEMINSGNFDDEDFDEDEEEDDDDQDVMDFDDDEDEEEFEEEEEEEEAIEDEEELEGDEDEDEQEDDDEIDEDAEIGELEDQLVDDLFDEMNDQDDEEEEEEEEDEEEEPPMQIPTKKLSKQIEMSGKVFQGVARVEDYLKQEAEKPKKRPEMIRELNPEDELAETSDLSADEEEDDEEDEEEEKEQPKPLVNNKYVINDREGLNNKLRELKLSNGKIPWVHTLAVTSQQSLDLEDVHDDFKREIAFYKQTLHSVTECEKLCADHGLTVRRKPDFFAEMIKSDAQMLKIKSNLQSEKKRVETAEAIRKKREIKKFGKQVQTQKLQERQKQKSDAIESVKKWRKNREKGNVSDEFNIDLIDDVNNNKKDKKKVEKSQLSQKSDKRKKKDAKYGFGGKKRFAKSNDKSSTNDVSGFSLKRNNEDKDYSKGKGGKMNKSGGRGGGKSSRPGKSRRSSRK
ncbi:hypothetical protein DICPUDRAFT_74854 [Dictyostelium purpureum]|uniref:rRNA-processing protein EBP2 n=1 Tax=Dictyostelium purpureum TaxID=5786 RepID=F0Z8X9_DICPU|nr:uncharacterized protein DICPUDRAFT_74854 [Dictyostelium purpureum]EGC39621.1 hypothetical protein DICPUDRAFT_74854 [Dictyostelium purpureum]|eukprot:XP_003283842.1 hypothetical protein DICPUDRAFT_74854 [Dictyostelium purpureum]